MIINVEILGGPDGLQPIFIFDKKYDEDKMISMMDDKLWEIYHLGTHKEMIDSMIEYARYEGELDEEKYSNFEVLEIIIQNGANFIYEIEGE